MKASRAWFLAFCIVFIVWALLDINRPKQGIAPLSAKSVTIILIDGLSQDLFNEELAKGRLPHLQSLMQRSLYVENGISSFPTMTGYAFYPFLTGTDACESGIYGLRWFDKEREKGQLRNYVGRTNVQMNYDVKANPQNLFELAGTSYTCSINSYMNRPVGQTQPRDIVYPGYAAALLASDVNLRLYCPKKPVSTYDAAFCRPVIVVVRAPSA